MYLSLIVILPGIDNRSIRSGHEVGVIGRYVRVVWYPVHLGGDILQAIVRYGHFKILVASKFSTSILYDI